MGCCFSKSKPQNEYTQQKPSPPKPNPTHEVSPPPPQPPQFEEESVKEVLSETPITKPHHQVPILTPETDTLLPPSQNPDVKLLETENPIPNPVIIINKKEDETSEVVSELSEEPCSVNESFSTTTTITEKREDEVTSKRSIRERTTTTTTTTTKAQKLNNNRSPLRKRLNAVDGNVPGGRDRRMKSPARRTEPSPEKKLHGGIRSVRGRESGAAANRKLNVASGGVRRDAGEGSGRRSRSPSCTRTAGKAGPTGGGRKQVPVAKGTVEKKEKKGENGSIEIEQKNDVVSQEESTGEKNDVVSQEESIENPLVSMECFIFL